MQKLQFDISDVKKVNRRLAVCLAVLLVVALSGAVAVPKIYADNLQSQIDKLVAENDQSQSAVDSLTLQSKSFEDAIAKLQADIDILRKNMATNKARQADLQKQMTAKQKELDAQREILGADIKAMYVSGQLSTLEMLATSKDLNEFVDSSTYREKVQLKVQETLEEITTLQNQLQDRKNEVDTLLAAQRVQQDQLEKSNAKQRELLAYNTEQRNAFNSKISANQDKLRDLFAKQAALNGEGASRVSITGDERGGACDGGSGNGGYYLASGTAGNVCDTPKDSITDWAGIDNRECTSYAYWYFKRVAGNKDFTAWGDAKLWVETSNYPVHDWPKVDAMGVIPVGQWGHVTIVKAIGPATYKGVDVPSGQVLTAEMNKDLTGKFTYNLRNVSTMKYIYK